MGFGEDSPYPAPPEGEPSLREELCVLDVLLVVLMFLGGEAKRGVIVAS